MMRALVILLALTALARAAEPTHYAEVGPGGVVIRVIVADKKFIESGRVGDKSRWVETSPSGAIRKNFAGPGSIYDATRDAFIPPQPFKSWVLDEMTARWKAPVERPQDGKIYGWDESTRKWKAESVLPR